MGNTNNVQRRPHTIRDKSLVSIAFVTKDEKTSTFIKEFSFNCTNERKSKFFVPEINDVGVPYPQVIKNTDGQTFQRNWNLTTLVDFYYSAQ